MTSRISDANVGASQALDVAQRTVQRSNFRAYLNAHMRSVDDGQLAAQRAAQQKTQPTRRTPPQEVLAAVIAGMRAQAPKGRRGAWGEVEDKEEEAVVATAEEVSDKDVAFERMEKMADAGDSTAALFMAQKQMAELGQQFNLQYLLIQQKMNGENRQFTVLSHVLKAKTESAKKILRNMAS